MSGTAAIWDGGRGEYELCVRGSGGRRVYEREGLIVAPHESRLNSRCSRRAAPSATCLIEGIMIGARSVPAEARRLRFYRLSSR